MRFSIARMLIVTVCKNKSVDDGMLRSAVPFDSKIK